MSPRRELSYHQTLSELVCHALLHLLSHVSMRSRFVPTATRNDILVKYLKPRLRDPALSSVKKDIKSMIAIGRHSTGNLERKLYAIQDLAAKALARPMDKLCSVLEHLQQHNGIDSQVFSQGKLPKPNVVYLMESDIETTVASVVSGSSPIPLLVTPSSVNAVTSSLEKLGGVSVEMKGPLPQYELERLDLHL
ncbi:DUF2913 family protein [Vibrio nigripulchritudo]|uniref:DUF2913 family protein n=1 Tax=Vibrio nigripulchritudo TaxID=28173 RepID=UPI0003B1E85C|nr:DUF2913 family protein [Vibrio nigripulchritudo]CCN86007.1 conserved hypothetical protein [Vibrio nigripulchritudo BLFn1]CCN97805.1 conserved hypothetical protein [Vibrio nigripulchritudo ENn2]CCO56116.1 conserved hypothetical protein [Vibrio nigripulchritudo Wn13]